MADLFKQIIPSILQTKADVLDDEESYVPYVINKSLSFHYDCVMYANQMNMLPHLDKKLQYHYFINTIRPYKRPFQKWLKRETVENLEAIKEYYKYSNDKAKEALKMLSDAHIDEIKRKVDKGGLNVKHQRSNRGDA